MTYNPNISTKDCLALNGYAATARDGNGRKLIVRMSDGVEIGWMDCFEADEWLRNGRA